MRKGFFNLFSSNVKSDKAIKVDGEHKRQTASDKTLLRSYWPQTTADGVAGKIEVLRPKPSPKPLIRIGGNGDGAYLLPDDLEGISACFSPGVNNRKDFEDELCEHYAIACHLCDYSSSVDKLKTPLKTGQTFKRKWLAPESHINNISLADWVEELAPQADADLILQMDIEGAEYNNLINTAESTLRRFRIIVIELHELQVCQQPEDFNKTLGPVLQLLDQHFICVHARANNCCGEFILHDSPLNLPNVIELTFLRRDRWQGIDEKALQPPLLPHPLDIAANVPTKQPLFLNEHWFESGERPAASTIKLLSDQVNYLSRALKQAQRPPKQKPPKRSENANDLYRLAQYTASALPMLHPKPTDEHLMELAKGKSFSLSSRHATSPKARVVNDQQPYFFHTREETHPFITIDLEAEHRLFELRIKNRSDICRDRARFLFYTTHHEPAPSILQGFPIAVDEAFLTQPNAISMTELRGCVARYLSIFSSDSTFLHFSMIQIMGSTIE
ncbi:MAG: FkbM family methyltransferase [Lamprobacter sp.]|uniref:FkbM family methyltransferase n=1 Tax=Lamprobacter sp. TaxID=3100796 RepID=UPI002B257D50|nr:FkbM family methyltransferase [Lamprobacter sp.]MEA3640879.1 FkbM family methyltransferase [Lamprobacter sp.]